MDQPKKLTMFRKNLRLKILNGDLDTDRSVYLDTLQEGFLPADGKSLLKELIKSGHVRVVGGQPRVSMQGYGAPRHLEVLTDGAD